MRTTALFFPFSLFGSPGTATGVDLLADALREMLDDNQREKVPTRARAYSPHVNLQEIAFPELADFQDWRGQGRSIIRRLLKRKERLFWFSGNHLGVLPVYEELAHANKNCLVLQLDAHLDVYNLSDCTEKLSHGNFLLHSETGLPTIVNVGSRELLLTPQHVSRYYKKVHPTQEAATDADGVIRSVREVCSQADQVFIDLDCDVFDQAFFPAVTQPSPFGLDPMFVLRLIDAAWSDRMLGVAISEFDPGRDTNDRCLATLVWLIEHMFLKIYEK